MQTFRDFTTQQVYQFDRDVIVDCANGVYRFFCSAGSDVQGNPVKGAQLNLPATLQPYTMPAPTAAEQLAQAQDKQKAAMRAACAAAIQAGFTSSALGAAHSYGSMATDQSNIALAAANGGGLWCADGGGVWAYPAHSVAQAQQVQKDLTLHIQAAQGHYATQLAAIDAAVTIPAVQAIAW